MNSYSPSGEDLLLWECFGARPEGFFAAVDANHPTKCGQIWLFEQQGWKGILVEPIFRGFDLARHRPVVLPVEDHLQQPGVHHHPVRHGYRVVKRTGEKNWYVPKWQPFHMSPWTERLKLFRKMFLGLPFRKIRMSLQWHKQRIPSAA